MNFNENNQTQKRKNSQNDSNLKTKQICLSSNFEYEIFEHSIDSVMFGLFEMYKAKQDLSRENKVLFTKTLESYEFLSSQIKMLHLSPYDSIVFCFKMIAKLLGMNDSKIQSLNLELNVSKIFGSSQEIIIRGKTYKVGDYGWSEWNRILGYKRISKPLIISDGRTQAKNLWPFLHLMAIQGTPDLWWVRDNLPLLLTCPACRKHYSNNSKAHVLLFKTVFKPSGYVRFVMTCQFHNFINENLGKKTLMSNDEIQNLYNHYISFISKLKQSH